jgi:hypothetical protein
MAEGGGRRDSHLGGGVPAGSRHLQLVLVVIWGLRVKDCDEDNGVFRTCVDEVSVEVAALRADAPWAAVGVGQGQVGGAQVTRGLRLSRAAAGGGSQGGGGQGRRQNKWKRVWNNMGRYLQCVRDVDPAAPELAVRLSADPGQAPGGAQGVVRPRVRVQALRGVGWGGGEGAPRCAQPRRVHFHQGHAVTGKLWLKYSGDLCVVRPAVHCSHLAQAACLLYRASTPHRADTATALGACTMG